MQSFLKKAAYVGLTVFALGALSSINNTTVNAKKHMTTKKVVKKAKKSKKKHVKKVHVKKVVPKKKTAVKKHVKVTATYYKVHFSENGAYAKATGIVSIMNKPGKLGNARVVASKTTMRRLANSDLPENVFHVYGMAKTNTGLYYAHVVTLSGKYRGWIYVGKNDFQYSLDNITAPNAGVKATKTLRYANLPSDVNVKISSALWTYPNYSRYNAKVINHKKSTYIKDKFVIKSAVYNTRGWLYYYVQDTKKNSINGWIYNRSTHAIGKKDSSTQTPSSYTLVFKYNGQLVGTQIVKLSDLSVNNADPIVNATSVAKFIPSNYEVTAAANAINTDGPIVNGGTAIINLTPVPATRLSVVLKEKATGNALTPSSDLITELNQVSQDILNQKLALNGQSINADSVKMILTNHNLMSIDQSKLSTVGAGSLQFDSVDSNAIDPNNPTITLFYK